jgi:hypothetical protein
VFAEDLSSTFKSRLKGRLRVKYRVAGAGNAHEPRAVRQRSGEPLAGLRVGCELDQGTYPKGQEVTDTQMAPSTSCPIAFMTTRTIDTS